MPLSSGNVRKLNFPLRLSESPLVSGGDMESPPSVTFEWPVLDPDERIPVTLSVSLNELVAIASAIDVGRDIAFGSESIELWQIWARSINPVDICQLIADCLADTDSPAYLALMQVIEANQQTTQPTAPTVGNTNQPDKGLTNPLVIEPVGGCDPDNLFGAIVGILDFINACIVDLFEQFEVGSNVAEKTQITLSAIPVIGSLPIDEIILYADSLASDLAENYLGAYTVALRDEMACELYCQLQDTCELNFQTLANYFGNKFGQEFLDVTFEEAIQWLSGFSGVGDDIVYASHFLFCQVLAFGSTWGGTSFDYFVRVALSLWNDPNPDWATLCTACAWCYTDTLFTDATKWNSDGGTDNLGTWASYSNPSGIHRIDNATTNPVRGAQVEMLYNFGTAITLTKIEITYAKEGSQADNSLRGYKINDAGSWVYTQVNGQTSPATYGVTIDFTSSPQTMNSIRLGVGQGYATTGTYDIKTRITSIKFYGQGTIPFSWPSGC